MDPVRGYIESNRKSFIVLNQNQLKELQSILIDMLRDFIFYCEKNNITYFLGGGTALGSVRDKGMIPWDDDVDLVVPRKDYERIKKEYESFFNGKYTIEAPNTDNVGVYSYLKIKKPNTTMRELICDDENCEIFLDIFPLEYVSNNSFKRYFQCHYYTFLRDISYTILYAKQYKTKIKPGIKNCKPSNRFLLRAGYVLGSILSIIPAKKWINHLDKIVAKNPESNYVTIPNGMQGPKKETFKKEYYFPPKKGEFEGMEVNVANRIDDILALFYGDYMTPPPPEKRGSHYLLEIDFNK